MNQIFDNHHMNQIFAVFGVYFNGKQFAVTTRPSGGIGFPGGKVDNGEMAFNAMIRESGEEGFLVTSADSNPYYTAIVDGKLVAWYKIFSCEVLNDYKEKYRGITPIFVSQDKITSFGNEMAIAKFFE